MPQRRQGSLEILRELLHRQGLSQGGCECGDGGQGVPVCGGSFGRASGGSEDIAAATEQALTAGSFLQGRVDAAQGLGGVAGGEVERDSLFDERERRPHAGESGFERGECGGTIDGGEELSVPQVVIGPGCGGQADTFAIVAGSDGVLPRARGDLSAKKPALVVGGYGGEVRCEILESFGWTAGFVLHPRTKQGDHRALGLEPGGGSEVGFGLVPLLMMTVELPSADVEIGLGRACNLLRECVEKRLVGAVRGETWRQCENRGCEGE